MSLFRSTLAYSPADTWQSPSQNVAWTPPGAREKLPWQVLFFLVFLGAITVIGKGPTYLGIPPLYWAEIAMLVLLNWAVRSGGWQTLVLPDPFPLSAVITAYCVLGAILTIASLPDHKLDAARDAAIWYYAAFYFGGLQLARHPGIGDRVWKAILWFWVGALSWGVANGLSGKRLQEMGPMIPWRGVNLLSNSNSEQVQHMATGALVVLGTDLFRMPALTRIFMSFVGLAGLGFFLADYGRASKVGLAAGLLVVIFLGLGHGRGMRTGPRLIPWLLIAAVALMFGAFLMDVDIEKLTNFDRFKDKRGTFEWRMIWWKRLYEAVMMENPAFGLGFGRDWQSFNPEIVSGVYDPWPVRAPHNFNMTVFSRMGFVGFFLWAFILLFGIGGLCARAWRARFPKDRQQEIGLWILVLLATWGNSSFGVLMEGPALGVWFWFALGFAWGRSTPQPAFPQQPAPVAVPRRYR